MLRHLRLLPLAAAFLAAAAAAQTPLSAAPLAYRSPLADYQPFADEKPISWKDANDTVGRIGGWREYARETGQAGTAPAAPAAAPAPAQAPATPAPATGHGGHQH